MALTRITKGVIKPNENYQAGIVTATGLDVNGNGDISGDLNVGGILTYEDVTSIDSVGIITAQKGIHVGAGISAVGVGTFGSLDIGGDVDVDGHTNLDNVSVAGVSTFSDEVNIIQGKKINFGNINGTNGHIYYDGSTTRFQTNVGLNIGAPVVSMKGAGLVGVMGEFIQNGAVKLWYNSGTYSTAKLETTATGVTIDGTAVAGGLDISGDIDVDGHTNLDNVSVAGITTFSSGMFIPDNQVIHLGNVAGTGDLQIYHDTNHSYVKDVGTGDLVLQTQGGHVMIKYGSDTMALFQPSNKAELYFANSPKLATTNIGITVTGQGVFSSAITASTYIQGTSSNGGLKFYSDSSASKGVILNTDDHLVPSHDSNSDLGLTGTRWRNVYADTLYGDGSNLTGITQTTISGNANNRIITGSGTANTLNAESTFTYDGDGLLSMTSTSGSAEFTIVGPNNTDSGIYFNDGSNDGAISYDHSTRQLKFRAGGHTRMYFAGGNDSNNNVIYLSNASYDDGILQYYNGGLYLKTGSSSGDKIISFSTAGSERFRITAAGTAVFGGDTSTPIVDNGELFYRGNSTQTFQNLPQNFYLYSDDIAYNGTNPGAGMLFGGAYHSNNSYTTFSGIHGVKQNNTDGDVDGILVFGTRKTGSNSWERARLTSEGTFSIGNTNPDTSNFRLDCSGSARFGTGNAGARIQFSRSGLGDELVIGVDGYGSNFSANDAVIQSSPTFGRPLIFGTNNQERLRIETNGELRLRSQNGNNADTPGIRFRGGSSSQQANFARIHSRMVSNWGGQLQFKVKQDDGSLADNYLTGMKIDENGHVTKPNQPSFHVGSPNNSGSSSGQVWKSHANAIYSNVGSHYDNSTGRFTAPVAGQYFFFHWGMTQSSSNSTADVYSRKNGSRDQIGTSYNGNGGGTGGYHQFGCSYVRTLSAGDYVDVYTGSGSIYYTTDGRHGGWGGWLIG